MLAPYLVRVSFKVRERFETSNVPIRVVYFPESGIISVIAKSKPDRDIEVGIVGYEGMTGLPLLMGDNRCSNSVFVQVAGAGWSISSDDLLQCFSQAPDLRVSFLRFAKVFLLQTSHTASANGRARIPQRLARWLLMAQDRLRSPDVPLTHELFATMLAVRRPGVTAHLRELEAKGLVHLERGSVQIADRVGLRLLAEDFYGVPEIEYERLVGSMDL